MSLQGVRNSIVIRIILAGFVLLMIGSVTRFVTPGNFLREDLQKVVWAQQQALAVYMARDIEIKIIDRQTMLNHLAVTLPAAILQQPDQLRDWLAVR